MIIGSSASSSGKFNKFFLASVIVRYLGININVHSNVHFDYKCDRIIFEGAAYSKDRNKVMITKDEARSIEE